MKTLKPILLSAALLAGVAVCRAGDYGVRDASRARDCDTVCVSRTVDLEDFDAIETDGSVCVSYTQKEGPHTAVLVLSENIDSLAEVYVEDGTLHIGFKKHSRSLSYIKYNVAVSSSSLRSVRISGSADVVFENGLETDRLSLSNSGSMGVSGRGLKCGKLDIIISGAAEINFSDVDADDFTTEINGTGDINLEGLKSSETSVVIKGTGHVTLSGTTKDADYRCNGTGVISCENLEAGSVTASVAGTGDIRLWATDYLMGRIAGDGTIRYKGSPVIAPSSSKNVYPIL